MAGSHSPNRVSGIFGVLMAAVEALNGLGVAFTSNPNGNQQDLDQGLVLASLGVQLCVIACFVVIVGIFHWRYSKANIQNKAFPTLPLTIPQHDLYRDPQHLSACGTRGNQQPGY